MLPITVTQKDRLTKTTALKATPRLVIDANINRVHTVQTIENPLISAQGLEDNPRFPVSSVVLRDRPRAGIVKAMTSSVNVPAVGKTAKKAFSSTTDKISLTSSVNDKYKYWQSETTSSGTVSVTYGAANYDLPYAQIRVVYSTSVYANYVKVVLENTYVDVTQATIDVIGTDAGSVSLTAAQQDSEGNYVIYNVQGTGWTATYDSSVDVLVPAQFTEMKFTALAIDKPNSRAAVIEFAPHYVKDVTSDIRQVTNEDSVSEPSVFLPIGTVSSNTATVVLDNTLGDYIVENAPANSFAAVLGKGARVTFDVNIHTPEGTPASSEWTRVLTKVVDKPSFDEDSVSLSLKDSSRILQARKPPNFMMKDATVTEIATRLCYSVGFRDVAYDFTDLDYNDVGAKVNYYWTDPERTVWEHLVDLSESTQTAFYFDEYDYLQVKTRSAAFDLGANVEWILDADDISLADVVAQDRLAGDNGKFADLVEPLAVESDEVINYADVKYKDTAVAPMVRGNPTQVVAWEPSDTTVLRQGVIYNSLPASQVGDAAAYMRATDAETWPYNGMFQLEGEVIGYDAKWYRYYDASDILQGIWVTSAEEKNKYDAINDGKAWMNHFTGALRIPASERGKKGTKIVAHEPTSSGWVGRSWARTGATAIGNGYFTTDYLNSRFTISASVAGIERYILSTRANPTATRANLFGTRIMFPASGYSYGAAGIVIGRGTNNGGFYLELRRTAVMGTRQYSNELHLEYIRSADNARIYLGSKYGTPAAYGAPTAVIEDRWYDLDVYTYTDSTYHIFTIWLNGAYVMTISAPKATTTTTIGNEAGFFTRGSTIAHFDYFYAMSTGGDAATALDDFDGASYIDRIRGGYQSQIADLARAATFSDSAAAIFSRDNPMIRSIIKKNFFFDEFGLLAHEIRDYDVKYENYPAVASSFYKSNPKVICTDFSATPSSAKFTLVNASRTNEVVYGEDTITYGIDNSVDQKLFVYGQMVERKDEQSEITQSDADIVKAGQSEVSITGEWVQSKNQAKRIGEWIVQNPKNETATASIFANPFLQLLDKIGVQDDRAGYDWRVDQYFITGKRLTFDGALEVDLDLRRLV